MKLTRKQKAFADHLLNNPKDSATEAAAQTYNVSTRDSAEVIASENLSRPSIQLYLEEHIDKAKETVVDIMNNSRILKDEPAHGRLALEASKEILDRNLGKATQRVETHSTSVNLNLDLTSITDQQ